MPYTRILSGEEVIKIPEEIFRELEVSNREFQKKGNIIIQNGIERVEEYIRELTENKEIQITTLWDGGILAGISLEERVTATLNRIDEKNYGREYKIKGYTNVTEKEMLKEIITRYIDILDGLS